MNLFRICKLASMAVYITSASNLFQIITASPESSDTFFVQWATKCLPEDGKYKCIDTSQQDPAKVDNLLNQFSVGGELKTK